MKKKKFIIIGLIVIFSIILIFSAYNIIMWMIDNNNNNNIINDINNSVEIIEKDDDDNTEVINKPVNKEDPYFDYIKTKLIDVDLKELKNKNSDTVGWINVSGTNINYPFVQTNDNDYYLTHAFDKSHNNAGWIFLDYRNDPYKDSNIILYGHDRVNGTMFGPLKSILTNGWLNTNNHTIRLSLENENSLWQVFSLYVIPVTSDYLYTNFGNKNDYKNFINMIKDRSKKDFGTMVSEDDRILTLSTCYNDDNERIVLHAKLIKKEAK